MEPKLFVYCCKIPTNGSHTITTLAKIIILYGSVTVGEMLVARGTRFLGLEDITDGLSSQDSYNIVKELKAACESVNAAAIISLNQPSDEIVQLFDNILVLDSKGELAYFGPASSRETLRDIFVGPNAKSDSSSNNSNAYDAGSICDLCLNPMTDDTLADAIRDRFVASPMYENLQQNIKTLNHKASQDWVEIAEMLPSTKYAGGVSYMFKVLGKRKAILIKRNPSTYLRAFVAVFFGVVVGSLFSVLQQDVPSSLARTAYLFQCMFLVLMLSTGVTVPQNIRDRVTYFKHRSAEFYSSRVNYVCQILYDLPLSILEAVLLSVTSYFWVDMNREPGRFACFVAGEVLTFVFYSIVSSFPSSFLNNMLGIFSFISCHSHDCHGIRWVGPGTSLLRCFENSGGGQVSCFGCHAFIFNRVWVHAKIFPDTANPSLAVMDLSSGVRL